MLSRVDVDGRIETASLSSHVILASVAATWPENAPNFAGYLVAVLLLIPTIFIAFGLTLAELNEYREFIVESVLPTMARLPGLRWIEQCLPKRKEELEEEEDPYEDDDIDDDDDDDDDDEVGEKGEVVKPPGEEESDRIAVK